jgi:type I restriction enzyme R subunit
MARAQIAVLRKSSDVADLRIELLDRLSTLQMHLNPVREKAEVIKRVKSDEFWQGVTVSDLEAVRQPLREIMHHRERSAATPLPAKVIDVTEDAAGFLTNRRATNLKTVDMKAYQQIVEAELKRHFETNPTLQKIRAGEAVSESDIQALVSLVLVQSPNASRDVLQEFFSETALPLDFAIRSIVGLDPVAVGARFAEFARRHPKLTAKQTRFLGLLQNHIARFGSVTLDRLYEQPFTVVDADGLDGVFEKSEEIDDLLDILSVFAPPPGVSVDRPESLERTSY